jgi:hypothetical protein
VGPSKVSPLFRPKLPNPKASELGAEGALGPGRCIHRVVGPEKVSFKENDISIAALLALLFFGVEDFCRPQGPIPSNTSLLRGPKK